jgi:hypothetical protein
MLNQIDDFPIHQSPEPIARPVSNDLNVYDRTRFNRYALVREGIVAPLYATYDAIPGVEDGKDQHIATARQRMAYVPGTRLAKSAEMGQVDHDGGIHTITVELILKFQMKSLGYGQPVRTQGMWNGELAIGDEASDPLTLDILKAESIHGQQVVRATGNQGRTGIGVLEQACFGPYVPSGYETMLVGVKA